jgi:hypothetical protein
MDNVLTKQKMIKNERMNERTNERKNERANAWKNEYGKLIREYKQNYGTKNERNKK